MSEAAVPVTAVVVASRGGASLEAALGAVAWAAERVVLDPVGRADALRLPAGVGVVVRALALTAVGSAPWVLLLRDDEVARPALRDAVAQAIAFGEPRRVRRELHALGAAFRLRSAPLRLAPRAGCRVELRRGMELALRVTGSHARLEPLVPALVVAHAPSLEAALEALDADTVASAALLELGGTPVRLRNLVLAPCAAAGRVLVAHAARPAGLARWVAAVLLGYGAVVAHARLWERVRDRPIEFA